MSRKQSREIVYKLLFSTTFPVPQENKTELEQLLQTVLEDDTLAESELEYIKQTYAGVSRNFPHLMKQIESNLKGYTLERLYKTDMTALLLAVFEIENGAVPPKVAVNEAVDIAKKYGSDKSGPFVNGVLAGFLRGRE